VRAIGEYDRFAKHYPKSRLAAEAAYLAAWLSLRRSRRDGERRLEAFVRSQAAKGSPRLRDDALWELGFSAFERGEHARSLRWLEKLPKAPSGMEAARVDYWRGRALVAVGSEKEARAAYRDALYREPLGWYAQLSAARLRELGEPPPPPVAGGVGLSDVARPELDVPSAVGFYRRLGMLGDAARVAEQWAEGLSGRLATIAAYATAGAVDKAHERAMPLLGRLMQVGPDEHSRWLWRAAFPEPYAGVVRAETERRGLPRELFYGHMQVESRYRPSVVSGADAVGLMQLLPSTAKSVAEAEGIDFERRLLMQPAVNVRLGAHYLSSLVKRYGEQWPLAIAAYNAGTQRVDGWLGRECPCELDRWVERIPVEQTRNYVRRVVGAWSRYHYLARPDAPWAVPLPVRVAR
jgi:soluble lytic murein transglycosylase